MEEDEEEGDYDNMIFHVFAEYGAFDDTAMEEVEEETAAQEEVEPVHDLGQAILDAQRECESDKVKIKFERMIEDHRKLLNPTAEEGQKS
jgi:hypothetical protein